MIGPGRQSQTGGPMAQTGQSDKTLQKRGIAFSYIQAVQHIVAFPETLGDSLSARDRHFEDIPQEKQKVHKPPFHALLI